MSIQWENSYTKQLVDEIKHRVGHPAPLALKVIDLLTQYHHDYHIPYAQRDAARAELKDVRRYLAESEARVVQLREEAQISNKMIRGLQNTNAELRKKVSDLEKNQTFKWDVYNEAAPIQEETIPGVLERMARERPRTGSANPYSFKGPPQEFFCCHHYPLAILNYYKHRTTCEHGCHNAPIQWWSHGRHEEPR